MGDTIYLRPLQISDASISAGWRNNPKIWRFTGARPDTHVTPEMEASWLTEVLLRPNEKRFAICIAGTDQYIGNIYLTDITGDDAMIHIFIGELAYWGGGRALQAIALLTAYGFTNLSLKTITACINPKNGASASIARASGFEMIGSYYDEQAKEMLDRYVLTREKYLKITAENHAATQRSS